MLAENLICLSGQAFWVSLTDLTICAIWQVVARAWIWWWWIANGQPSIS